MKPSDKQVIIIGAGNVGTHMAKILNKQGYTIRGVCSRTTQSARTLARLFRADAWADPALVPADAQFYFLCVNDENLPDVVKKMPDTQGLVMHTSGTLPLDILNRFANHAVMYPFQTFSKNRETDFSIIPVCIEAPDKKNLQAVKKVAKAISDDVRVMDSKQRQYAHLAGVFCCNFSNFMFVAATDILREQKIEFNILVPLILEFFEKTISMDAWKAQTGPAIRGDYGIIESHLNLLENKPGYHEIYRVLSEQIMERKHKT